MTGETPQPNPMDLARETLSRELSAENMNSLRVITALDGLENIMKEQHYDPQSMFTELAAGALSARDQNPNDPMVSQLFNVRADNYMRTAGLLRTSQEAAGQLKELREGIASSTESTVPADPKPQRARKPRTSKPTTTPLQSSMSAKK